MADITRRGFVAGAATAALASVGAGVASADTADGREWADVADVVVVGGGGTGLAAAWEVANAGLDVLVLEKSEELGGNTGLSGGMIQAAGTKLQAEKGIEDDVDRFAEEQLALGMGMVDEDIVRDMCTQSPAMIDWLCELGRTFDTVASVPSFKPYSNDSNWAPRVHQLGIGTSGYGKEHTDCIWTSAQDMGARATLACEVTHLVKGPDGGVIGVEASMDGQTVSIKARRGVVLAAAGIDNNLEMARELNKMQFWALSQIENGCAFLYEKPTNTGDGIRMGMEIGAALNLSEACVMIPSLYPGGVTDYFSLLHPDAEPNKYGSNPDRGVIFVNCRGNRFMQEDAMWGHCMGRIYQEVVDTGKVTGSLADAGIFGVADSEGVEYWRTADRLGENADLDELVEAGSLLRADTVEALAEAMGVDAANLARTVERWNQIAENGQDPDFGRETDFAPIEHAPYYACPVNFLTTMGTAGGLRIDVDCHVLDTAGEAIPRLFAAGQNAGGWMGKYYHSCGWAVLGTVVLGRNAGRAAAATEAWE